jgi:tetratricopeptide (TPR) repeat protein
MKIVNKVAITALGLVFAGSGAFAQSLADAKKAVDAEQYQKAKVMLKNLTVTQPTKDENFFYLGQAYIAQDYTDSARIAFNKGIALNPKSALNYAGLGLADRLEKNPASAKANFDKALLLAGKDAKPYIYVAEAYVYKKPGEIKALISPDPTSALAVLDKAKVFGAKDPDFFAATGDAYRAENNSSQAYIAYTAAQGLDPNNPKFFVALGVLVKNANNFDDAIADFQAALAKDPTFGPAYREWAETNFMQASFDKKTTIAKDKEAVEHYKKYLDLTDRSIESRLRYADFLVSAHDYKALETEAADLSKVATTNLRVYRYIGYAGYENKNFAAGTTALTKWLNEAEPRRIIPLDYYYLGHLQLASGQDTTKGVDNLKRYAALDSTKNEEVYTEIATMYKDKKKWADAAKAYDELFAKVSNKPLVAAHFYGGFSYLFAFRAQVSAAKTNPSVKPDSTFLTKGDSALSFAQQKLGKPNLNFSLYRAYINDVKDPDPATIKGLSKPYYEQVIAILLAMPQPLSDANKSLLADAYAYLGNYYEYHDKDDAKAGENFTKAKEADPTNGYAKFYFDHKTAAPPAKSK